MIPIFEKSRDMLFSRPRNLIVAQIAGELQRPLPEVDSAMSGRFKWWALQLTTNSHFDFLSIVAKGKFNNWRYIKRILPLAKIVKYFFDYPEDICLCLDNSAKFDIKLQPPAVKKNGKPLQL
jgi:hypothetical protein